MWENKVGIHFPNTWRALYFYSQQNSPQAILYYCTHWVLYWYAVLQFSSESRFLTSSHYSHCSVSNVGSHCSKTEELTCWPFMLKLWLLIVKLCDRCLPMWWVSVHSRAIYFRILNDRVFLVKTRDFLHENCAKCRELCVVFWKKCVLELQFECKAGIVLVV